jgi:hypothetical protein
MLPPCAAFVPRRRRTAVLLAAVLAGCAAHPVPLSGDEIRAMLSDHTAILPGGFVEYYAPDGKLHGWSDGQPYEGSWEIRGDLFCNLLDTDSKVCSQVGRDGDTLYWSPDGDQKISRISRILPGNPRNLQ